MVAGLAFLSVTIAAFMWGLYTVLSRMWGTLAGGVIALPFVMLLSSLVLFGLRFWFNEVSHFPPEVYLPLAYVLAVPYVANVCWDIGTRRGSITLLSLLADGLPWASTYRSKSVPWHYYRV